MDTDKNYALVAQTSPVAGLGQINFTRYLIRRPDLEVVTVLLEVKSEQLDVLTVRRTTDPKIESWVGWEETLSYWLQQLKHPSLIVTEGLKVSPSELALHSGVADEHVWFFLRAQDSNYGAVFLTNGKVVHGILHLPTINIISIS